MLEGSDFSKAINVATIGMDDKEKSRMEIIFKANYKGQCKLSSMVDADIAFIDTHKKTQEELEKLRIETLPNLKLPFILLGENIGYSSSVVCMSNPPKLNVLWENILKLTKNQQDKLQISLPNLTSVRSGHNGKNIEIAQNIKQSNKKSLSSIDAKEPDNQYASLFFRPDDFLLGKLHQAIDEARQRSCSIQVTCWDNRRIIVYPKSGDILSDLKPSQFKNLGLIQVLNSTKIELCDFDKDALYQLSKCDPSDVWTESIDAVLWGLALRTSRGRLPEDTSLSQCYQLLRWPNFTRLARFPHCIRIAAYWVNNPTSLTSIAKKLAVEEKYVFLFYSAACAVNLVRPLEGEQTQVTATKLPDKKHTLFAALLNNLSGKLTRSKARS